MSKTVIGISTFLREAVAYHVKQLHVSWQLKSDKLTYSILACCHTLSLSLNCFFEIVKLHDKLLSFDLYYVKLRKSAGIGKSLVKNCLQNLKSRAVFKCSNCVVNNLNVKIFLWHLTQMNNIWCIGYIFIIYRPGARGIRRNISLSDDIFLGAKPRKISSLREILRRIPRAEGL
jgi:hypothetical protein